MAWPKGPAVTRDAAIEITRHVNDATRALFDAAEELRPTLEKREFRILAEALCKASFDLDDYVLKPIYREHPDLRPKDMEP